MGRSFPRRGHQVSQHYLKDDQKLDLKIKFFFLLKVRSNNKTLNEQELLCMREGVLPCQYLAFCAKVLSVLSEELFILIKRLFGIQWSFQRIGTQFEL